jgi:hypothetical protein
MAEAAQDRSLNRLALNRFDSDYAAYYMAWE